MRAPRRKALRGTVMPWACALMAAFLAGAPPAVSTAAGPVGPPSQGSVLLRIDGAPVTWEEFEAFLDMFPEGSAEDRTGGVAESLERFVNNKLLSREAKREGIDTLPSVMSKLGARLDRLWAEAYWAAVVRPSLRHSEEDLLLLAPPSEDAVSLQQMTVPGRREAEILRSRVAAGEDFGVLARAFSEGLSADRGGAVGYVGKGNDMYDREFMEEIFRLPPGGISDVRETPLGYVFVRVNGKRSAEEVRREWLKANRSLAIRKLSSDAWRKERERLLSAGNFKVDAAVLSAFRDAVASGNGVDELLGEVVATSDGIPLRLGDVADPSGLGIVHGGGSVEGLIRRRIEDRAVAREAERIGLRERLPGTALRERVLCDEILARAYIRAMAKGSPPTEMEARIWFEGNRGRFARPRMIDLSFIETTSPPRLALVLEALAAGTSFEDAARRWSDNHAAPGGRVGWVEESRIAPDLLPVRSLAAGEYTKTPIRTRNASTGEEIFVVGKLNGIRETRAMTFEEVGSARIVEAMTSGNAKNVVGGILRRLKAASRIEPMSGLPGGMREHPPGGTSRGNHR